MVYKNNTKKQPVNSSIVVQVVHMSVFAAKYNFNQMSIAKVIKL